MVHIKLSDKYVLTSNYHYGLLFESVALSCQDQRTYSLAASIEKPLSPGNQSQKTVEMCTEATGQVGTSRKWTVSKTRFDWGKLQNNQWSHFQTCFS